LAPFGTVNLKSEDFYRYYHDWSRVPVESPMKALGFVNSPWNTVEYPAAMGFVTADLARANEFSYVSANRSLAPPLSFSFFSFFIVGLQDQNDLVASIRQLNELLDRSPLKGKAYIYFGLGMSEAIASTTKAPTTNATAPTIVTGTIKFDVQLPANATAASFVKDAGVKKGVEKGIAKKLAVPFAWVSATLTVVNRRLAQTRHLAENKSSINVEFKVTIPPTAKATQSASAVQTSLTSATKESAKNAWGTHLTDSIKEEAKAYKNIQVSVSSVAHVPVTTRTTKAVDLVASVSTRSCLASIFLLAFVAAQA